MDKKMTETIIEVISYLFELRYDIVLAEVLEKKRYGQERSEAYVSDFLNSMEYITGAFGFVDTDIDLSEVAQIDDKLIKLNALLSVKDKIKVISDIEQEMKKIQVKKYITRREFTEIYNISISSQDVYRGRLYDPLPYHQKVAGGKVVYVVDEVEKWFANQHK